MFIDFPYLSSCSVLRGREKGHEPEKPTGSRIPTMYSRAEDDVRGVWNALDLDFASCGHWRVGGG